MSRDVLYLVGTGSKWDNNELKFSLRSLEKHYSPRRVYICGYKPEWVKNVIHLEYPDVSGNRLTNTNEKLKYALSQVESQNLVLMNDDFFILSKIERLEVYYNKTLKYAIRHHSLKSGYYYLAINELLRVLNQLGIEDPLNYSLHVPFPIEVSKAKEVFDIIAPLTPSGFLFRSAYGNVHHLSGIPMLDVKLKNSTWRSIPLDAKFLSSDDYVVNNASFKLFLKRSFPEACSYETI